MSKSAQLLFVARIFVTVLLSNSIYISNAKCPMEKGEPIRWQIRCQLRGSCLETITASLPPQFKFQTSQRRSSNSLGSDSRIRNIKGAELFPTVFKVLNRKLKQALFNHHLIPINLATYKIHVIRKDVLVARNPDCWSLTALRPFLVKKKDPFHNRFLIIFLYMLSNWVYTDWKGRRNVQKEKVIQRTMWASKIISGRAHIQAT